MTTVASCVLSIRAMELSDIDAIATWFDDPEDISLFERSSPIPIGREARRAGWKEDLTAGPPPAKAFWYIACGTTGDPAAISGLHSVNYVNGDCVLPVFVAKTMRGKGIGVRLAALLLDLAFDRLRLTRVTTYYREDNKISEKLVQRIAFKEEGRMRKAWFCNGVHLDMIVAGVLREEWAERRIVLQGELDPNVVVRFGTGTAGRLTWPKSKASGSSQEMP
jgi:RimJ/RimL family protein N-acetyltransferase